MEGYTTGNLGGVSGYVRLVVLPLRMSYEATTRSCDSLSLASTVSCGIVLLDFVVGANWA